MPDTAANSPKFVHSTSSTTAVNPTTNPITITSPFAVAVRLQINLYPVTVRRQLRGTRHHWPPPRTRRTILLRRICRRSDPHHQLRRPRRAIEWRRKAVAVRLPLHHPLITVRRQLRQPIRSIPSSSRHHLLAVVGTRRPIPSPSRHHLLSPRSSSQTANKSPPNNSQTRDPPANTTNPIIITSPARRPDAAVVAALSWVILPKIALLTSSSS